MSLKRSLNFKFQRSQMERRCGSHIPETMILVVVYELMDDTESIPALLLVVEVVEIRVAVVDSLNKLVEVVIAVVVDEKTNSSLVVTFLIRKLLLSHRSPLHPGKQLHVPVVQLY